MGNSPSNTKSDTNLSRRASDSKRLGRQTSSSISHNMLSLPDAGHRRSRSAQATARSIAEPPPPYTAISPVIMPAPAVPPEVPPKTFVPSSDIASPNPSASRRSPSYLRTPMRQQSKEDALETLRKYNTVLIIDDSASMQGNLWREANKTMGTLADLAGQYDTDGIDIHFLNNPLVGLNMKTALEVQILFNKVHPRGITPIAEKLEDLLQPYLYQIEKAQDAGGPTELKKIKPVNFIVITDGAPTDDPEPVIVQAAKRLDARHFPISQLGIQFVQIGSSRRATEYLARLDDDLQEKHKIRDIVDTTPYIGELSADMLIKILLGGINRRVDVRRNESQRQSSYQGRANTRQGHIPRR